MNHIAKGRPGGVSADGPDTSSEQPTTTPPGPAGHEPASPPRQDGGAGHKNAPQWAATGATNSAAAKSGATQPDGTKPSAERPGAITPHRNAPDTAMAGTRSPAPKAPDQNDLDQDALDKVTPETVTLDSDALAQGLSGRERDFLHRIFGGDLSRYSCRTQAIGFTGLGRVLDAGAGFGQWTLALAQNNAEVTALEYDPGRTGVILRAAQQLGLANVRAHTGDMAALPYGDASFDAVFCYSAIYIARWRLALAEFARVLRPGGRLYICANGFGFALHNLVENPNPSRDFHPRLHALKSVLKTLSHGAVCAGADWILSPEGLETALRGLDFDHVRVDGDGRLAAHGAKPGPSFYAARRYGMWNVFELLARKGTQTGKERHD